MDGHLFTLLRDYYALTPINRLHYPFKCSPKSVNDFLVNELLTDEHHQHYPPSVQYQTRFWKWALENLENSIRLKNSGEDDDDFDIDSRIYDYYMSLMLPMGSSQPTSNTFCQIGTNGAPYLDRAPTQSYITHFWKPSTGPTLVAPSHRSQTDRRMCHTITLLESRTVIENGTTGLRTWFASFVLAQYLILHPDLIRCKCVLELGSGIGFLGIIIASLQLLSGTSGNGGSCWLTDVNDDVLARCKDNIKLPCNMSSAHPDIHYLKLDWLESLDDSEMASNVLHENINSDIILGADLAFAPSLIPALAATLKIALQTPNTSNPAQTTKVALIALTLRNGQTLDGFIDHIKKASLVIEELNLGFDDTLFSEAIESHSSCSDVKLFRITLNPYSESFQSR